MCGGDFDGDVVLRDVWPVRYDVRVFVVCESCCELNEDQVVENQNVFVLCRPPINHLADTCTTS